MFASMYTYSSLQILWITADSGW